MIEFYTAISVGCATDSLTKAHRRALERLQGLGVVDLVSAHENGSLDGHSAFGDKGNSACTQSLNECFGSASVITAKVTPSPRLAQHLNLTHNPRISGKPSAESQADSESKESLESHFDNLDSNTESSLSDSKTITESESKQPTQSTTPKNPSEALPDLDNGARKRKPSRIYANRFCHFCGAKIKSMCRCDSTNCHSPLSCVAKRKLL